MTGDADRLAAWEKVNRVIAIADCRYAISVAEKRLAAARMAYAYYTSDEYKRYFDAQRSALPLVVFAMPWVDAHREVDLVAGELELQRCRLEALEAVVA